MRQEYERLVLERTTAWSVLEPQIKRWDLYSAVRLESDTPHDQLYQSLKEAIAYYRDKDKGNDRDLAERLTAGWNIFLSDPARRYVDF